MIDPSHVRSARKAARAAIRQEAAAAARCWRVDGWLLNAVVIAYTAEWEVEPAAQLLTMAARRRQWPPKSEAELARLVEDVFSMYWDASKADFPALIDADAPADAKAMRAANAALDEWRVVRWALRQNIEKGVAPSTQSMLDEFALSRALHGHSNPHAAGSVVEPRARMFISRVRRRWGGRYGSMPAVEELSAQEMQDKASAPERHAWRVDSWVSGCGFV